MFIKTFIECVTIFLFFMVVFVFFFFFFGFLAVRRILAHTPGIELAPCTRCEVLTTGPLGKSFVLLLFSFSFYFVNQFSFTKMAPGLNIFVQAT